MHLTIFGLPVIAFLVGITLIFSVPVWLAARFIGAENPSLLRSALSLIVGSIASVLVSATVGLPAFFSAPLCFVLAIKFVLRTSVLGAMVLAVLAAAGCFLFAHLVGGGVSVKSGAGEHAFESRLSRSMEV